MASRLSLQTELETLLGVEHVYYQPPESVRMQYPAIRYSKTDIRVTHANDSAYSKKDCYEVIVIDTNPDNAVISSLLSLPYCRFDRHYVSDNLDHTILLLYY